MARTKGANTYTDKEVLNGLRKHCVDEMKSKYSLHDPCTWQAIVKRINKGSKIFINKVQTILAEADARWEQLGIDALQNGDGSFNVSLFKMYASSKKPFQSYETNELEERIERLENGS